MRKSIFKIIKGKDFLGSTPNPYRGSGNDKLALIKIKQDAMRRIKRQAFDRKEILGNHVSDERLGSRVHEEYPKCNHQKAD